MQNKLKNKYLLFSFLLNLINSIFIILCTFYLENIL